MAVTTYSYEPDYAVPPGWVIEEHLQSQRLSHAEFARRCGRSAKLISEIIAGKAPVEPRTALQFEKVLGLDASIWLGIEARYQLHKARQVEAQETKKGASWIKGFPLKELVHRGVLDKPASDAEARAKLLAFFGVGSVNAWYAKYEGMSVAYRHSPSFQSDKTALATWLRLGELKAEQQDCGDYSEAQFKRTLKKIRGLTQTPVEQALEEAQQLCNEAGVALVLLKPFPKTALSGAAWWLTPRKAVIELSVRHKTDDHLWFSLFHEAAHVLLHSKKQVFIDWMKSNKEIADVESEANLWASNFLIPHGDWKQLVATPSYSEIAIRQFAEEQGIAPSIIVGRLQHEGRVSWQTPLNRLKKPTMTQEPSLKKQTITGYLHKLKEACEWLNIEQGRATDYIRLLDEFAKAESLSGELLAYYESYEIVELFELWEKRVDEFPGLRNKIRKVCKKGPVLREDETMSALSNRPRNDAFCFLVAGKFLAADIPVVRVDGIASRHTTCASNADFTFRWKESYIDVECKRLQSEKQLLKRAEEARDQSTRSGRCGIIAIDCSVLCRPAGTLLENSAPDDAEFRLSEWLRTNIGPKIRSSLSPRILGFILFVRVPAMTAVAGIDSRENFVRRRDVISSWLVVGNPDCPNPKILENIALRLNNQAGSTLSGGGGEGSDVSEH